MSSPLISSHQNLIDGLMGRPPVRQPTSSFVSQQAISRSGSALVSTAGGYAAVKARQAVVARVRSSPSDSTTLAATAWKTVRENPVASAGAGVAAVAVGVAAYRWWMNEETPKQQPVRF